MPPRRLIPLLAVLTGLVACPPAVAIVGGGPVAIEQHPYQVALLNPARANNFDAQFCGGTIRDATHIITAGHCVFNVQRQGQVALPSQIAVLAGTSTLSKTANTGRVAVSQVSVNPGFNAATLENDSALLTLPDPGLNLGPGSAEDLVSPVSSPDWGTVAPGASLVVSGWGTTAANNGTTPPAKADGATELQRVTVPLVDDPRCEADYAGTASPVNGSLTVCAGDTVNGGVDSCQGDSGGPLVRAFGPTGPDDYELVGIVSSGIGCAQSGFPGLYTEVAAPSVRNYITEANPVAAPDLQVAPSLSGTATVGSTLACSSGTWNGSPVLSIQWVHTSNGADTALTGYGAPETYAVQPSDVASTISCIVRARNDGGRAIVRSPASAVAAQPPAAQPAAPAPAPPARSANQDSAFPVVRILSARCVHGTCTLKLNVTDAGFSAGIAKVTGTVRSTYRARCTKNGRRTTCTRHRIRAFSAHRTAPTRFTVKVARLPAGTQLFTLLATDRAGHRQLLPTRRTLRTRR